MSLSLAALSVAFSTYRSNSAAKRAAELFAQDLSVARGHSVRSREIVSVRFDEAERSYVLVTAGGDSIVRRSYADSADFQLDQIDLQVEGDSLTFDMRGRIDFGGVRSSLGRAVFVSGDNRYSVRFNTLGATRVAAQ